MRAYAVCHTVGGDVAGWYVPEEHRMLMLSALSLTRLPPTREWECWLAVDPAENRRYIIKKRRQGDPLNREYDITPLPARRRSV